MTAELNPVARTAFYCCALRARDAARPRPVCGDSFAARFLDEETRRVLGPALALRGPSESNVARHRMIDELLEAELAQAPERRVILIGAGFDTRAFRLRGGRWWEIEVPELLDHKEARLPARTAPNPLTRVPFAYGKERIASRLAPLAGTDPAIVVVEGVTMYLPEAELTSLAEAVRGAFPNARFLLDLMSPAFARRFATPLRRELAKLGARFAEHAEHPRRAIEAAGWRVVRSASIPGRAQQAGTLGIPRWLLNTFLKELRDGYALWEFSAAPGD
jgi:methyltransferase (TIGR00027 family)